MVDKTEVQLVTLVGFGAIGRSIYKRMRDDSHVRISHIVVRPEDVTLLQVELGNSVTVCSDVPSDVSLLVECAGHAALIEHVLPALAAGIEVAVLSIGALSEPGLPERLAEAAEKGGTQVHLLAGAIGGVDAISAARIAGLDSATYTGRKPPLGWKGTPAEKVCDLSKLTHPTVIFEGTARQAALLYPKNANVAATVSLAGLGLDVTRVQLIADPGVTENIHDIDVSGAFGHMHVTMRGKPLADNPKTSALTLLSALRFLQNRTATVTI